MKRRFGFSPRNVVKLEPSSTILIRNLLRPYLRLQGSYVLYMYKYSRTLEGDVETTKTRLQTQKSLPRHLFIFNLSDITLRN